jgi:hypothetical protein
MPETAVDDSSDSDPSVEIRLSRPQQLFNSFDPSPFHERDLDENAAMTAASELAASCPTEMPITPAARMAAIAKRLDAMLSAVKAVRAPLEDLYNSLNDEQKAQFNLIGQPRTAQFQG